MTLGIFQKESFFCQLMKIIFRASLIVFLVFFVLEALVPGFVVCWFNPIGLLIIAAVSGIMLL